MIYSEDNYLQKVFKPHRMFFLLLFSQRANWKMENDSEAGKLELQGSKPERSKMFSKMCVAMVTASIVSSVSPQLGTFFRLYCHFEKSEQRYFDCEAWKLSFFSSFGLFLHQQSLTVGYQAE